MVGNGENPGIIRTSLGSGVGNWCRVVGNNAALICLGGVRGSGNEMLVGGGGGLAW